MLRESGCVTLPSQRTLRDYTYYVRACTGEKLASNKINVIVAYGCNPCAGFSSEVDKLLLKATTTESNKEWEKYVVIVMDEMPGTSEKTWFMTSIQEHLLVSQT